MKAATMNLPDGRVPVVLSAHEHELLAADAAAILHYLHDHPAVSVAQIAATLLRTRRIRRHRAVLRAASIEELDGALQAVAQGSEHPLVSYSSTAAAPRAAFVFPGQGNQWPGMGREAYESLPEYLDEAQRCAQVFGEQTLRYLLADNTAGQSNPETWSQREIQTAQFTHAVSMARVWQSCALVPDLTVGHSLGEVAAAYIAGALDLADAAAVVIARATVIDGIDGDYGMGVLAVSPQRAQRLIDETPGWMELSVVNAPESVVVSGDADAVAQVVAKVEADGCFARLIAVNFPAHTSALEPLHDKLLSLLPDAGFADTPIGFIGSAHGRQVAFDTRFRQYWYDNLRNTVRFDEAVRSAAAAGAGTYVELSAHPTLLIALGDLVGEDALTLASARRDEPVADHLSGSIAAAAAADPGYQWSRYLPPETAGLYGFPNAPMARLRLWAAPEPLPPAPLQVVVRTWVPATALPQSDRRVAVVGLTDADPAAVSELYAAVERDARCAEVPAADADTIVAVAPCGGQIASLVERGLLRELAAYGGGCQELWLVTANAEEIPGDPSVDPVQAALAGSHRSIGHEYPDCAFRHVDMPSWHLDVPLTDAVIDGLFTGADDLAVRMADGAVAVHRAVTESAEVASAPVDAGVLEDVVITGGAGAVGMHFAEVLVAQGARRIVLLSRGGSAPEAVEKLRAGGAQIVDVRCDITDPDAVRAAAQNHADRGATLVVHAAGAAVFGPADGLDGAAAGITFDAKCAGLEHVMSLWPQRESARTIICSSISGLWGGLGHGLYSAANRFVDALAARYRRDGRDVVSVRWGLWPGEGIVDAEEITRIRRSGLLDMPPGRAILAALGSATSEPLIFSADPDRLRTFLGAAEPDTEQAAADSAGAEPTAARPDGAAIVTRELAAALRQSGSAEIDLSAPLIDMGVDSLLALDLRKRLRQATGTAVPLAALLGGITGRELVELLEQNEASGRVALVR